MTKLKTLKDLKRPLHWPDEGYKVYVDELKQEAIKWAKKWKAETPKDMRWWIPLSEFEEFFNITEKDLK